MSRISCSPIHDVCLAITEYLLEQILKHMWMSETQAFVYLQCRPDPERVTRIHRFIGASMETILLSEDAPPAYSVQFALAEHLL